MGTETEQTSKVEGSGRQKGTPNKMSKLMKESIILAAERQGEMMVQKIYGDSKDEADQRFVEEAKKDGMTAYLQLQAEKNPTAFMTLMGKVLPMQVNAEVAGDVVHVVKLKWQD